MTGIIFMSRAIEETAGMVRSRESSPSESVVLVTSSPLRPLESPSGADDDSSTRKVMDVDDKAMVRGRILR